MKKIISTILALSLILGQFEFIFALDGTSTKKDMIVEVAKQQGISEQQAEIWVNYLISGKLTDYQQKLYDRAYPRLKVMIEKNGDVYRSKVLSLLRKTANSILKKNMDYHIILTNLVSKIGTDGFIKDFENKLDYVNFIDHTKRETIVKNIMLANSNEPDWSYGDIWSRQYNIGFDHIGCRIFKPLYNDAEIIITTLDEKNDMYTGEFLSNKFTIATMGENPITNKSFRSIKSLDVDYKYDENIKPANYSSDEAFQEALNKTKYIEPTMRRDELFKKEDLISISKPIFPKEWNSDFSYIELVQKKGVSISDDWEGHMNLYILSCSLAGG